jgi:hypothetical protein
MNTVNAVAVIDALKEVARKLTIPNILSLVLKIGKAAVCVLFLLNIRSWPLVWHCEFLICILYDGKAEICHSVRIFRPVIILRAHHRWVLLRAIFKSSAQKAVLEDQWLDSISSIGSDPFAKVIPFKTWASA